MKNSFILYQDQEDIFKKLTDDQAGKLIKAIFQYEKTQIMPELDLILDISITSIKSTLDRNRAKHEQTSIRRAEAGSKGGKQKVANLANASNCYDSDSDSDSDSENNTSCAVSPHGVDLDQKKDNKRKLKQNAKTVLDFLNSKINGNFRSTVNLDFIEARLKTGATVAQCKAVIAIKRRQWIDNPEMSKFLRPKTLFNKTNFEQYLGEMPKLEPTEENNEQS